MLFFYKKHLKWCETYNVILQYNSLSNHILSYLSFIYEKADFLNQHVWRSRNVHNFLWQNLQNIASIIFKNTILAELLGICKTFLPLRFLVPVMYQ